MEQIIYDGPIVFGKANAKLKALEKTHGKLSTFSVLSGHTCPYAKECHSKAVVVDGKRRIQDGKHTKFRCFSASQEVQYDGVYRSRAGNSQVITAAARDCNGTAIAISRAIPKNTKIVRIHVGGDFKTQAYFDCWMKVAETNPQIHFYAYTKSLPFWVARMDELKSLPNFVLTASRGGWKDEFIEQYDLREAVVVYSEEQAAQLELEIDHDDSHAANRGGNFALLIHGTQPKGSEAGEALKQLKRKGWTGYSDKGRKQNAKSTT